MLPPFDAFTFDCYGTLIDWERGIVPRVRTWFQATGRDASRKEILRDYARFEHEAEHACGYRPYRECLHDVARRFSTTHDLGLDDEACAMFAASVGDWPAFEETPNALRRLSRHGRLAIISNVDDDLLEGTLPKLGVSFDEVVTAAQVRSYKPDRAHFDEVKRRLGDVAILHVAQSLFHDVVPATALGWPTVWVDRTGDSGATPRVEATPTIEVSSLNALADLLEGGPADSTPVPDTPETDTKEATDALDA